MAKKLKPSYKTLEKIKKPVLIIVKRFGIVNRIRLLYPNGECLWDFFNSGGTTLDDPSCFVSIDHTLPKSVHSMKQYDEERELFIKEIIEL